MRVVVEGRDGEEEGEGEERREGRRRGATAAATRLLAGGGCIRHRHAFGIAAPCDVAEAANALPDRSEDDERALDGRKVRILEQD